MVEIQQRKYLLTNWINLIQGVNLEPIVLVISGKETSWQDGLLQIQRHVGIWSGIYRLQKAKAVYARGEILVPAPIRIKGPVLALVFRYNLLALFIIGGWEAQCRKHEKTW